MLQIEDSVVEALVRRKPDLTAIDYYGDKFCQSETSATVNSASDS